MADTVDVRRLRLQPGDTLVLSGPGVTAESAQAVRDNLDRLGHAAVPLLFIGGDISLFVLPGSTPTP